MNETFSLIANHFGIRHEDQKKAAAQLIVTQFLSSAGGVLSAVPPKKCRKHCSNGRTSSTAMVSADAMLLDLLAVRPRSSPSSSPSTPLPLSSSPSASSASSDCSSSFVGQFRCRWGHCYRFFASSDSFLEHIRLDHLVDLHISKDQRRFACLWRDCERGERPFSAIYMLVQHLRSHTGEKPYKCEWTNCEKRYSRLENLKTHQRKHTGERPYQCTVCERSFTNASDKAKHVNRVHKEKKQFHCAVLGCGSAYTDPSSLRKHTLTSHGPNPWLEYKARRRTVEKIGENGQKQRTKRERDDDKT